MRLLRPIRVLIKIWIANGLISPLFTRLLKKDKVVTIFVFTLGFLAGALIVVVELCLVPRAQLKSTIKDTQFHLAPISNSTRTSQAKLLLKIAKMQNLSTTWLSSKNRGTRILCWVMTTVKYHMTRSINIKKTWGKHCNVLLFMSDGDDDVLPAVNLKVDGSYQLLWGKTVAAFKYAHDNYANDYDWVVKVDDDTFLLVENLRKMLMSHKPTDKKFWGYGFKMGFTEAKAYPSGGAGYIVSKEGVKLFVEFHDKGNYSNSKCPNKKAGNAEDYNFGRCMEHLGVKFIDSRDTKGRNTISPFPLEALGLFPGDIKADWWYITKSLYPVMHTARENFSPRHLTQHYITPVPMYWVYYLLQNMQHPFPVQNVIRMSKNSSFVDIVKYPVDYKKIY